MRRPPRTLAPRTLAPRTLAPRLLAWLPDRAGAAAVEFAMILPAFASLIIGGIYTAQLLYAASSLRYAVEAGARCYSINTTVCTSATTTQNYALGKYMGPAYPAPTFTATTPACGHQVAGSETFVLNAGITSFTVPLSATACFP
jgi:Flp pilus assembly protein TadG